MQESDLKSLWSSATDLLAREMTQISLNTWVLPMEPVSFEEDLLVLSVPNEFHAGYVRSFLTLIQNTFKALTSREIEVRFVVGAQEDPRKGPTGSAARSVGSHGEGTAGSGNGIGLLNPKYTFENFVVGNANRFAHAASVAVAEKPNGSNFNPLFMYGGSGLGKTHLVQAVANFIRRNSPKTRFLYVQCEQFVNEFINAISTRNYEGFRNKYRNIDVLLIDDIQFIEGKEQMQEEFFHTFNTLYESGKHIILTCDKPPQSLASLEARLRTRFSSGLIVDIQPPDYETRVVILKRQASMHRVTVPEEVFDFIATNIATNIRELEGAFNTVLAYSLLAGGITLDVARDALKDLVRPNAARKVSPAVIMDVVARFYGVTSDDLKSNRRNKEITNPRQVAMYLCRYSLDMSLPSIGAEFGNRDHSTVLHSCRKVEDELRNPQSNLTVDLAELRKRLI